jgi:hypothetical protein
MLGHVGGGGYGEPVPRRRYDGESIRPSLRLFHNFFENNCVTLKVGIQAAVTGIKPRSLNPGVNSCRLCTIILGFAAASVSSSLYEWSVASATVKTSSCFPATASRARLFPALM